MPDDETGRRTHVLRPDQLREGREIEPPSSGALCRAVDEQDFGRVVYLLALGADPNATVELESDDIVPLLWFAAARDSAIVFALLAAHADPTCRLPESGSSFAAIESSGWLEGEPKLLEEIVRFRETDPGAMVEEYRRIGRTRDDDTVNRDDERRAHHFSFLESLSESDLLHAAAMVCDAETICWALANGQVNPNEEVSIGRVVHTPLSLAFFSGSDLSERGHCMRLLIAGRADPFLPSSVNWTLLDEAADKKGRLWKLLQSIPQRNRKITDTETAANWIVHRLRHGEEVDTEFARSVLNYLVPRISFEDLVDALLAIPFSRFEEGEPRGRYSRLFHELLCLSAQHDVENVVTRLLDKGVQVDYQDAGGRFAAPARPAPTVRLLTGPGRLAQVSVVVRRRQRQRAAGGQAARRWRQVQQA